MTPDELLRIYDEEVRGGFARRLPQGWSGDADGPLMRCRTLREGFAMLTEPADDLSEADLRALVDRTVAYYRDQGTWFEWKTFDHDRPDLLPLLLTAGATAEDHEALILGEAALLARDIRVPDGIEIRQVTDREDLARIAEMEGQVWGEDWSWLADDLAARLAGDDPIHVLVAEADGTVVSAAWLTPMPGTRVAGLWGGSTLAAYRGRGVYRALVAARARRALDLGYSFLQVDASDDSKPILERLGLTVIGGTQPYVIGR